jgi:hypothetical protein
MKVLRFLLMTASAICITMAFQSCLDDDNTNWDLVYPNALVTVKPVHGNSSFFMQLDDSTTLFPTNMASSPFGNKEVRALVNYTEMNEPSEGYDKAVHINWIDSILTKSIAPNLGEDNDNIYGTDPVEIINDWVTIAEDGYLTLRFRITYGDRSKAHFVNLLASTNPENPYEVEFRHNAYGDTYGIQGDGLVAFNLNSLPDTQGKTVKLKLKWKSFSGDKSAEFNFCTRYSKAEPIKKDRGDKSSVAYVRNVLNLK